MHAARHTPHGSPPSFTARVARGALNPLGTARRLTLLPPPSCAQLPPPERRADARRRQARGARRRRTPHRAVARRRAGRGRRQAVGRSVAPGGRRPLANRQRPGPCPPSRMR
eukprot:1086617-Prymnesium_polylepis.1